MTGVPSNIISPVFGVSYEPNLSALGPSNLPVQGLIIGQMLAAGAGDPLTKYLVTSAAEVAHLAGFGSECHRMALKWFTENKTTTTYLIMQEDEAAGTTGTVALTYGGTTASVAGESPLYISGDRYVASVAVGTTFDEVAAAHLAEINADPNCMWTAAYATPTLTLTCRHKGIKVSDIDVRLNANIGEETPAGITIGVGAPAAGTVDPDVQDVIDVIGNTWFNVIAHSFVDETNLTAIEVYAAAQTAVMVERDGMWYSAKRDTRGNMITFGTAVTRNSQYVCVAPAYKRMNSTGEIAAAVAAAVALSVESDQAVPLHRITLNSLTPLNEDDRWTDIERNQLALSGIMTLRDDNGVQTDAMVTMYLKNSSGASDTFYQQQNRIFQLMGARYRWRTWISTKYPRAKLAATTEKLNSGQVVMTPAVAKAESVAWFKNEIAIGNCQNLEAFKASLKAELDSVNENRINIWLPIETMKQLIVGSTIIQFS